ncbi:hypothetical protein AJ79_00997 [Helicocarpus griseus UAMH5409]|uniref:Uncharacterized protein n=1 Tax=Helicocarpus griseus UAMH5409 TaxID=1447875 RepID=A0A2B7Y8R4_9EURO|nr:hypothetical protein AJ79_00997 [Helicocarpus griseus UAMH5409]
MAGSITPTKKRSLEDEMEATVQPGSQSKRSKLEEASTGCSSPCDSSSSSCESSCDSNSEDDSDATIPQTLAFRSRAPLQEQFDDETSSSGESESSISSSCSSSSSSDSESESESDDVVNTSTADDIIPIPERPPHLKPSIGRLDGSTLRDRLTSFLPELQAANEELEKEIAAGNVPRVELDHDKDAEDGQYIEMNLGLGVLEEKGDDTISDTSSESESTVSYEEDNNNEKETQPKARGDTNVLNKLMGNKSKTKRPNIEEVAS